MNRKRLSKLIEGVLILVVTVTLLLNNNIHEIYAASNSASISISASSGMICVGDTVTVSINLSAAKNLYTGQIDIEYDQSCFSYVSGAYSTNGSKLVLMFDPNGSGSSGSRDLTFKATAVGNGTFKVSSYSLINSDPIEEVEASLNSASVQVKPVGATDKTLGGLSVAGYSITPAFAKWTQDYTCYVGADVTSVSINATPGAAGNTPKISGNYDNLNYGSNKITITSYSNVDTSMTYTINVIRSQPAQQGGSSDKPSGNSPTQAPTDAPTTEAPTTEAPTDPLPVVQATVDNGNKYVMMDLSSLDVPSGYTETTVNYGKDKVPAFTNKTLGITVLYLTDEANGTKGSYYVYDEKANSLIPYQSVKSTGVMYVMLAVTDDVTIPNGFNKISTEILGNKTDGYVSSDNEEFILFYAVNDEGSKNWYCYDTEEQTVQRYAGLLGGNDNKLLEDANNKIQSLNSKLDNVSTPFSSKSLFRCLMISLAMVFALICSIIFMLCKLVVRETATVEDDIPDDGDEEFVSDEEAKAFDAEAQRLQMAFTDELKSEVEAISAEEAEELNNETDDSSTAEEETTATTEELGEVHDEIVEDETKDAQVEDIHAEKTQSEDKQEVEEQDKVEPVAISDEKQEDVDISEVVESIDLDEKPDPDNEIANELKNEISEELVPDTDDNSDDVISFLDDIDNTDDEDLL